MALIWNAQSEILRDPNLLTPGKMPNGRVKIDWSNKVTNKLHSCYLWNSFNPHDLTGRVPASAITVGGSAVVLGGHSGGRSLIFDRTASNQITIADDNTEYQFQGHISEGPYSILHRFIFDGPEDGNEFTLSVNASAAGNGYDTPDAVLSVEDGLPHNICCVRGIWQSTNDTYCDGEHITNEAQGEVDRGYMHRIRYQSNTNNLEVSWGTALSGDAVTDLMIAGTTQKTTDRWDGPMILSSFWQRALTEAEAISMTIDPYQILIPA